MNVLIACEESQRVCIEFRKKGHEAFSCDIQPCSGGHPEWHIRRNVLEILNPYFSESDLSYGIHFSTCDNNNHFIIKWDLIIAHPPCTYISNAGARWLYKNKQLNEERYIYGLKGKDFFMKILNANCDKIAIENPIPSKIYQLPKYEQTIQPYQFGEPWSKKTCLWLKGLPKLKPTNIINEHKPYCSSGSYSKSHNPIYKGASRVGGSSKSRSKTFKGIAAAMAEQWG